MTSTETNRPGDGTPGAASAPGPVSDGPVATASREAALLVGALLVSVPMAVARPIWWADGAQLDWNRRVTVAPFDLVLILISLWALTHLRSLPHLVGHRWSRALLVAGGAIYLVALAAHPSWLGLAATLRLGAGVAVVATTALCLASPRVRPTVLAVAAGVGGAQAALALIQSARGAPLGVAPIDFGGYMYTFGTSTAGRGGLSHPYHLAVLLVVCQGAALLGLRRADRARWWLAALGLMGAGLAVTYSRAALLGQVGVVLAAVLVRTDRHALRRGVAATAIGFVLGATALGTGWIARGSTSVDGASVDSGRRTRYEEALRLVGEEPFTGVGPGRYVVALGEVEHTDLLPAHDVILHQAAELGVLGGLATAALLALLAVAVVRRGCWALAVAAPMAPFLLLDAYPYVFATGLVLLSIWLALLRDVTSCTTDGATQAAGS